MNDLEYAATAAYEAFRVATEGRLDLPPWDALQPDAPARTEWHMVADAVKMATELRATQLAAFRKPLTASTGLPAGAITAAAQAIERELMKGTDYHTHIESDEALARAALEAAAPHITATERQRILTQATSRTCNIDGHATNVIPLDVLKAMLSEEHE